VAASLPRAVVAASAHNAGCLVCGTDNPASMHFTVTDHADGALSGTATFGVVHEGAPGRLHGGALSAVLDEALGRLAYVEFGGDCVTASLTVAFKAPAAPGDFRVAARRTRREGRKMWVSGEIAGETVVAEAQALFIALV
jgi:acyl-coenzyme A thioesterase PaaI-like protein